LSEFEVFGQEKGVIHVYVISDFRQNRVYKRLSEIVGGKMEFFFLKKVIRTFLSSSKSAPGLRQ